MDKMLKEFDLTHHHIKCLPVELHQSPRFQVMWFDEPIRLIRIINNNQRKKKITRGINNNVGMKVREERTKNKRLHFQLLTCEGHSRPLLA